jgi:lysophospholipase L1-like esterase
MGGTRLRTNALGLRGDEVVEDGRRRILAIGDSCTWGYQVREEESYPALLARLLDEGPRRGRYRVVNAGTPGFTSYHGLVYLRERGLQLNPALVLIGYEWNDGVRMGDVVQRLERVRRLRHILALDDWLRANSDFYRLIAYQLGPRTVPKLGPQVLPLQYRENVTTMIGLAHDHGAQAALVDWNAAGPAYSDVLDEVSAEHGVPLVRFYGPRIPGDVVHPSAEGYRRFVGVLYRRLREAGYLGKR